MGTNTTGIRTTVATFLCPSDMDRLTNPEGHYNYCGNWGSIPYRYSSAPSGPFAIPAGGDGGGGTAIPITIASITDGTSNTAGFSERVKGIGNGGNGALSTQMALDLLKPTSVELSLAATSDANSAPTLYYAGCTALSPTSAAIAPVGVPGGMWHSTLMGDTCYNHVMPPNSWSCVYSQPDNNHPQGALNPSSRHPGLVNVLFLDGTVRPAKNTINVQTWWALGTMANGEVVSADSM